MTTFIERYVEGLRSEAKTEVDHLRDLLRICEMRKKRKGRNVRFTMQTSILFGGELLDIWGAISDSEAFSNLLAASKSGLSGPGGGT